MKPKDLPEARIAWVLSNVLEEITERLWLRYGQEFIRLERQQEEAEVCSEERAKDPDLLAEDGF
jgi:hypothetical protein